MLTVGGHKVDDRGGVFQVIGKIRPAGIGFELAVARDFKELCAGFVEGWHKGVAAAGDVEGAQVQRQADQVVTQRTGNELVNFVADLTGHPAHDGANGLFIAHVPVVIEGQRVEECLNQTQVITQHIAVGTGDGFGQH
ncbi:hypothetical protein D3C75_477660 [compost metagenome]